MIRESVGRSTVVQIVQLASKIHQEVWVARDESWPRMCTAGAAYTLDWPVERYMRDAKLLDSGAGTDEIRSMLLGRELIGPVG